MKNDRLSMGANFLFSEHKGETFFTWRGMENYGTDSLRRDNLVYPLEVTDFRERPSSIDPWLTYFESRNACIGYIL